HNNSDRALSSDVTSSDLYFEAIKRTGFSPRTHTQRMTHIVGGRFPAVRYGNYSLESAVRQAINQVILDAKVGAQLQPAFLPRVQDRKSTRLNSSHDQISY